MRTDEERIARLHSRAAELEKARARSGVRSAGIMSFTLMALLATALGWFSGMTILPYSDQYSGSSLLGESAGGYVLTAVIAFTAAVVITVILMRRRR
jgi:hypothetical protein